MALQDIEKSISLEEDERESSLSSIRDEDDFSSGLSDGPAAREEDRYAEDEPKNPWQSSDEDKEEPKGVPGWPKSWPKWLVSLFSAACFWFAMNGVTMIKNCNERATWFDGVEEAGFHQAAVAASEDPYVWIGKVGDGIANQGNEEDGYYWYSVSQERTGASAVLQLVEGNKSVVLRSKTPITPKGTAYMRIDGHRIGYYIIRYTKDQQKLSTVTRKYDKLPAYEVDKVSYGAYIPLAYPIIRTKELQKTQTNGDISLTLEKIEYRDGLTLCYFSLKNDRTDDRTVYMNDTIVTASFQGQELQVNTNAWLNEMTDSGIVHFLVDNEKAYRYVAFYHSAKPGEQIAGALPIEGVRGKGYLEIRLDVFLEGKEETEREQLSFEFMPFVQEQ